MDGFLILRLRMGVTPGRFIEGTGPPRSRSKPFDSTFGTYWDPLGAHRNLFGAHRNAFGTHWNLFGTYWNACFKIIKIVSC